MRRKAETTAATVVNERIFAVQGMEGLWGRCAGVYVMSFLAVSG